MNRNIPLFFTSLLIGLKSFAIESDSLEMKAGYSEQVFYSLNNGVVKNASTKWDLAFEVTGFGSGIRINEGFGNVIYTYPKGTKATWETVDTAGISAWTSLHNSDKAWTEGALNQNPANDYDLGWGVYNSITHVVAGDSIFILKTTTGSYKKLLIDKLLSGTYTFKYADLDGENEQSVDISKSTYNTKNFVYFSFETENILDLEPAKDSWDLLFTKYVAEIQPSVFYVVTGVLQNNTVKVYKDTKVTDPFTHTLDTTLFQTDINTIGYNWKTFTGTAFAIEDSIVFFVKDVQHKNWRLVFTKFSGSASGKVFLTKQEEMLSALESADFIPTDVKVYPNPAHQYQSVYLAIDNKTTNSFVEVRSLSGKTIFETYAHEDLLLPSFSSGIYIISITSGAKQSQQKLIVY